MFFLHVDILLLGGHFRQLVLLLLTEEWVTTGRLVKRLGRRHRGRTGSRWRRDEDPPIVVVAGRTTGLWPVERNGRLFGLDIFGRQRIVLLLLAGSDGRRDRFQK